MLTHSGTGSARGAVLTVADDVIATLLADRTESTAKAGGAELIAAPETGRPWRVGVVVEFANEERAARFERYLKSGSGTAFAKCHLR